MLALAVPFARQMPWGKDLILQATRSVRISPARRQASINAEVDACKSLFVANNGLVRKVQVYKPSAARSDRDQSIKQSLGNIRILFFEFLVIGRLIRAI
jgi:hypothetical protein